MTEEAADSLYEVLRKAAEALKDSKFDNVKELLGEPYQQAMQAEKSDKIKEAASHIFSDMRQIVDSDSTFWIKDTNLFKQLNLPNANDLMIKNPLKELSDIMSINTQLHDLPKEINKHIAALQEQFEGNEKKLLEDKGILNYTGNLIQRRWDNTPTTKVKDALEGGKGLEKFGGIEHLDNPFKKGCAIAVSSIGAGLIVHGGYNIIRSIFPEKDSKLELEELGHTPVKEGVNWTRLAVGATEATIGTATLYAALTGRSILKAGKVVEGVDLHELTGCNHDHGAQGHHHH